MFKETRPPIRAREGVDLLDESCRLHQPRAIGDNELEFLVACAERAANQKRVWLVTAERDQHRIDAGFLRVPGKVRPAFHVRARSRRGTAR